MFGITRDIAVELGVPVIRVGSRAIRVVTARMLMPKAAITKVVRYLCNPTAEADQ